METSNVNKTNNFDPKRIEKQRFEFLLYINDHIICQRYFNIREFNEHSIRSAEMKELMDNICSMNNEWGQMGILPKFLKNKAIDYLWNNNKSYYSSTQVNRNIFEKPDNFQFEIRVDEKMVAKSVFSGNFFPPKVRYAVDIKEIIPTIMTEIRYFLSQRKYTKEYANVAL